MLFAEETKPGLSRYEKGIITRNGAISVDTGTHTECLTKDRYVVLDDKTRDRVWWRSNMAKISENKPVSPDIWNHCKNISVKQLSGKRLFVVDCFCGANENSRINVRFIMEIAWQAHFIKNHGSEAWLVNTGWMGGPYGTGSRIDLQTTRRIIRAILDDSIKDQEFVKLPVFNLSIPTKIKGVDDNITDPGKSWNSMIKWHIAATDLALKFINNFSKFTSNPETASLAGHGPRIS
jgi:ATP-dependent phosphoenolpyruvate carboxykinase